MKQDIIRGVLLDPYAELSPKTRLDALKALSAKAGAKAIRNDLGTLYNLLHCQYIDMTDRVIGGKLYTLVVDDEGLLIDSPIISAVADYGEIPILAGSIFICKSVYDPVEMVMLLASLDDDDIENIFAHIKIAVDTRKSIDTLTGEDIYPVLILDGDGYVRIDTEEV